METEKESLVREERERLKSPTPGSTSYFITAFVADSHLLP
jgi:hypothetical protein